MQDIDLEMQCSKMLAMSKDDSPSSGMTGLLGYSK